MGFPSSSEIKNPPAMQEMQAPGVGNGNPLQYSCLENPTDSGYSPWSRSQTPGACAHTLRCTAQTNTLLINYMPI